MTNEDHDLELMAEIVRRGEVVKDDMQTSPAEKQTLWSELVQLGRRAVAGGVPKEDWENHELHWIAYCSNLRSDLIFSLATAIIEFEQNARRSRERVDLSETTRDVLCWWHLEGGREKLLSELALEDRQALEKAEKS